jgi:lipopolysaccharide export system permease protein
MTSARILRRYITRRFITTISGTFLLCVVLIFMIDFVEMLRQAGKFGSVSVGTLVWITLLRLPAYTEILLAFAVLVGTITALLMLSRKSELAVMRAAGLSVWQLLRPGLTVALLLGVFAITVYNPVAAGAREEAERLFAEVFGRESSFLNAKGGLWLRQDGVDGPSVVTAGAGAEQGLALTAVTIFQFDPQDRFLERIDGATARLEPGFWRVEKAWVSRIGHEPEFYDTYLVSTYLTPERVKDAVGSLLSLSFWELPALIELAEKAGLSTAKYHIQYELLLSRPLLLTAMVLLGATVSLRSFRFGKIQTMVVTGMVGGIGFFLLVEVSRQIGMAGLVPPWVSVWVPIFVASLLSTAVLLHQEDG